MQPKTILIIDDDAVHRDLLREVLTHAGFAVVAVGDAADAFSPFGREIDLVLLDLVMPRAAMDGFAFLSRAGARPELVNVPVVVLSGLGESVLGAIDPRTASALRIVSVVPKPIDIDNLLRVVRTVLHLPEAPATLSS